MEVIIQSLGFTAGEELESFVQEKIARLENRGGKIIRANVTLFLRPKRTHENNSCEIRLEIPGNDLFVKKNHVHFENAITESIDALDIMLRKEKEKRIDRRRHAKGGDERNQF